jgi:hypothetical protein
MHANEKKGTTVNQGDLVIFPNGLAHVIGDSPETSSISFSRLVRGLKEPPAVVHYGGGGSTNRSYVRLF